MPSSTKTIPPVSRWPLRGGVPCLDFANTEAYRGTDHELDLLQSYEIFVTWAVNAGVIDSVDAERVLATAAAAPEAAEVCLLRAKELRRTIHVLMQSVALRVAPPGAALATLNAFMVESRAHGQIEQTDAGFDIRLRPGDDMAFPIWQLTESATLLLTSPEHNLVRECPGHECGWLFLDTTRNHSRRWCDSADCGNRARVQAYSHRKREAAHA